MIVHPAVIHLRSGLTNRRFEMRTFRWRTVAYGLAAASLCLSVAACDDDTGTDGGDGGMDDLSMPADMTGDGSMASLPSVQLVVADVQGTVYAPGLPDAGDTVAPLTHLLKTVVSFPSASDKSDFSNL